MVAKSIAPKQNINISTLMSQRQLKFSYDHHSALSPPKPTAYYLYVSKYSPDPIQLSKPKIILKHSLLCVYDISQFF